MSDQLKNLLYNINSVITRLYGIFFIDKLRKILYHEDDIVSSFQMQITRELGIF